MALKRFVEDMGIHSMLKHKCLSIECSMYYAPRRMYTHNAHPCFDWYIPNKSPILRELLNVESGNINGGFFMYFWKIKGINLQNNGVWRMVHYILMYERDSWMGLSAWTFFMPSGINNRSCTQSHSWAPNLHGINPVRCNKSFGSWCTRRKTSHLNQSLILQNSHTFHSIVTLHNLSFQPVILDGHRR